MVHAAFVGLLFQLNMLQLVLEVKTIKCASLNAPVVPQPTTLIVVPTVDELPAVLQVRGKETKERLS
jgi:hypothetical protein